MVPDLAGDKQRVGIIFRKVIAPLGVVVSPSICIDADLGAYARTLAGTNCHSCVEIRPRTAPIWRNAVALS